MLTQETLYTLYFQKIFNLAYRMTGNAADAGDITQETFIQAFNSLKDFKGESQPYTWLFRIAKNKCLQHLDKKKKSSFLSIQELALNASSPIAEEIAEDEKQQLISMVREGCLSGLLRCLSLQQRLVFILHILLDIPLTNVAAVIEKSENAARILLHRARHNIRDYLCENCSWFDSKNSCRCESLVNFSLKNNWIAVDKHMVVSNEQALKEITDLKDEILHYKALKEKRGNEDLSAVIQRLISERKEFVIFKAQKVK